MLDIASCGDILEPHLLPPDEALFWTDVLDHSVIEKYFCIMELHENAYDNILSWKYAVTAPRYVQTEGGSSEDKVLFVPLSYR